MNVYKLEFWTEDYIPYCMDVSIVANTIDEAFEFIRETRPNTRVESIVLAQRDVVILNPDDKSVVITNNENR